MNDSRMSKYSDLRAGLKDEAGINRNHIEVKLNVVDDGEDDFLASVNRSFEQDEKKVADINDTLTEAKTFEQMRQESSEEINRALRCAKAGVGKESQYNTRMDILNKIREPERQVVHIDNFDNVNTSEFSKGYFVNNEKEEPIVKEVKKKMTLMERLASMSPEEDVKKAKLVMEENDIKEEVNEDTIDQSDSLEDMLRQIKEKDQREVERVLKERQETEKLKIVQEDIKNLTKNDNQLTDEVIDDEKSRKVAIILNYIIVLLIVVFVGLCGMIGYQVFF